MPKGPVQTPITDQEIAFAHLVLAGTMTDQAAAEAVGIDPSRAAYVKGKPKVQAYMEEHRASVRAGLVQHEVEALAKFNISREQILAKWWEFGNLDPALSYNTSSQSRPWNYSGRAWAMRMGIPIRRNQKATANRNTRFTSQGGCGNLVTQNTRKTRGKRPVIGKPLHVVNLS